MSLDNLAAIASILSLLVSIVAWLWREPSPIIKKYVRNVFPLILFFSLGFWLSRFQNKSQINISLGKSVKVVDLNIYQQREGNLEEIGPSTSKDVIKATGVELKSTRDENGFTLPKESVIFSLRHPVDRKPLNGIVARVFIEPDAGKENQKVFCHFIADYVLDASNAYVYTSSETYIKYNVWNTLVWDMTGILWPQGQDWESNWNNLNMMLNSEGHYYMSITRNLSEQMLDNAINAQFNNGSQDWVDWLQKLGIECIVSADQEFTEIASPTFRGNISVSDIWVQEIDYPGLK